jgi:hypothetical protein
MVSSLKQMCEILDIERGGNKSDIIERIVCFLAEPKDSGKALPGEFHSVCILTSVESKIKQNEPI